MLDEVRGKTILLTQGILFEVINFLFQRNGKVVALEMIDAFSQTGTFRIIEPSERLWKKTLDYFNKFNVSLTDAEIVAAMELMDEKTLYSFDKGFDQVRWLNRLG